MSHTTIESDSSSENGEHFHIRKRGTQKDQMLWDSFQDPPPPQNSGSAFEDKRFDTLKKFLKLFTYIFVFIVVLAVTVGAKMTLLFMTSHIKTGYTVKYCDIRRPERELYANVSEEFRIAWIWAICVAFSIPEFGTLFRSARICFFRNIRKASWSELFTVWFCETCHVIGLAIFTFIILPKLDVIKGVMLSNAVCLWPAILNMLGWSFDEKGKVTHTLFDVLAILAQLTALLIWSIVSGYWLIPIALILISFEWWENFVTTNSAIKWIRSLSELRKNLFMSRYDIYLYVAPLKIITFLGCAIAFTNVKLFDFFSKAFDGWDRRLIEIQETESIFSDRIDESPSDQITQSIQLQSSIVFWTTILHILCTYLCYVFTKFACKIQIQSFSFALPINLTIPVTITFLIILCGLREANTCIFHNIISDDLFFKMPPVYFLTDYIVKEYAWVWLLSLCGQTWITKHIWTTRNDRNESTDKLFVLPMYCSLLVDQGLALNRRREDEETFVKKADLIVPSEPTSETNTIDAKAKKLTEDDIKSYDRIPQIFICATMWHENKEEMMEFLKSILRLDEDQCARRMALKYIRRNDDVDNEYYELETHIFFDDAFVTDYPRCAPDTSPLNSYTKLLVNNLEEAALEVYQTHMKIVAPTKIITPYGGRLVWTLPGRTKMIAHLKHKKKIRRKKRWSQVMYMYYLLGYRIMQMDASPERKMVIAQNTYLLALDGDIDFQPNAVLLLVNRMKVDADLGAACGRIHPIGNGPMVWYQVFEYAIGHWLQKATEHVIGCVLCSPGCFSLFRGRALMENSVMRKYTTVSEIARHHVQYDQGEDRWLCTLLLKQKFRVEYSAASDAYTHAPEGFNEFYNQRRRWVPSTMANILDLLADAKIIVKRNNSISTPYILYQAMLMVGTIIGPGTIFLMMVGALVSVFSTDIWTSFLSNFLPLLGFMLICYFAKQKYQLIAAFVISTVYSMVMMAVMIGIIIQVRDDGLLSPSSMFFLAVSGQVIITGCLHPQEVSALLYGIVYYITIPSMYMLLVIYSIFNMNDVSWGTRENAAPIADAATAKQNIPQSRMQRIVSYLNPGTEEEGSLDISFGGLFRCMFCTHPKKNDDLVHFAHITSELNIVNEKLSRLNDKLSGDSSNGMATNDNDDRDNESESIHSASVLDMENGRHFDRSMNELNLLPDWLDDNDLKNSTTETLSQQEEEFWIDLIEKYLQPIEPTEEEKNKVRDELSSLRDTVVFAFVMLNALFVLIVFLLQLKKEDLHVQWPFNAQNEITFDPSTNEITIRRHYLKLEPIGLLFVVFFGIILLIQFIAMLIHRFGTISQILATTKLDWYCGKKSSELSHQAKLKGAAVTIARQLQKPQPQWDEDNMTEEQEKVERRGTIHRILYQHRNKVDFSNLETNFKRAYFAEGDLNLQRLTLSRKTLTLLDTHRKSIAEHRKLRKSQLQSYAGNNHIDNNFKTAQWLQATQNDTPAQLSIQVENFAADLPDFMGIDNQAFDDDCIKDDAYEMNDRRRKQSHVTFANIEKL